MIHLLHYLAAVAALYFFLLALSNIIWLRLSSRRPRSRNSGKVSVLIPARNEERNIGPCLDSLLHQTYQDYEILVLDDQSTDRTWPIISQYAKDHPDLVQAVNGKPLPRACWNGKAYAMHQLAHLARGEYLLFTDADTVHSSESISWAVTNLERHCVDFISGYIGQELASFGEALLVPIMYLMSAVIMPLWLIPVTRTPFLSFAVGQVVMFRRKGYESSGGYASVSGEISDDIHIARQMRKAGFRTIFLDIRRHVHCRMYHGFHEAFDGLTKNISDFLNHKIISLVSASLACVLFFLLPYSLLLPYLWVDHPLTILVAGTVGLFQLTWCLVLYDRGLRWYVPFLYPLLFIYALVMMWRGYKKHMSGVGLIWKGRVVR